MQYENRVGTALARDEQHTGVGRRTRPRYRIEGAARAATAEELPFDDPEIVGCDSLRGWESLLPSGRAAVRHFLLVPEPDWIPSPAAAELGSVVRALRDAEQVAKHVTLTGLVDSWSGLVATVELGYEASVYEYADDVDSRAILDQVAQRASPEARETLFRWLRPWDERYEMATWRAKAPFHGRADPADPYAASRWHWRVPRRLVGELKSDLHAMGLA